MTIEFLDGLTIDIEKIPDYREIINDTFKEKLDKRICEIILHSDNPLITDEMKEDFENKVVDNLHEKGILEHNYVQQNDLGRFIVQNDTSLISQHSDKYIAFTLYKYMRWINFDMKTSWLSIVCETMRPFKKKIPTINLLVNDFDGFVETINKYYQKEEILDRKRIKELIYNFLIYETYQFSDWINYLRDKNISIRNSKKIHPLVNAYIKEITFVRKVIYENNRQLALYLKNKRTFDIFGHGCGKTAEMINITDTVILIWCEIIETEIVFQIYKFLTKEKIIKNNFCTMFADSIMFPYVECDKDTILEKFTKYIKKNTGFTFLFDFKSLEEEEFIIQDIIEERNQYENVRDDDEEAAEPEDDEDEEEAAEPEDEEQEDEEHDEEDEEDEKEEEKRKIFGRRR